MPRFLRRAFVWLAGRLGVILEFLRAAQDAGHDDDGPRDDQVW